MLENLFFFTDDACFRFSGYISSQNSTIWSTENQHALYENPLQSSKPAFLCAVSRKTNLKTLFFLGAWGGELFQLKL